MEDYDDLFEIEYENSLKDFNRIDFEKKVSSYKVRLKGNTSYDNLRNVYTEILLDEDCHNLLLEITSEKEFRRDFPEFFVRNEYNENVINCTQNTKYHRYGVLKHILMTIEEVARNNKFYTEYEKVILKWTMLLHDIGKPYVKKRNQEGIESFHGHDDMSVQLSKEILDRFTFSEKDKNLILNLIKYHDKYLNEGEVIYENMIKLSKDLGSDKSNFNLIIAVKDADNSAKSIEVYNEYKTTRLKYVDFLNKNFREEDKINSTVHKEKEEITNEEEYLVVLNQVLSKKNIECNYKSVIDLEYTKVYGVEVFSNIKYDKRVNIVKLLNYAKEANKFDLLEQTLFINALEVFNNRNNKDIKNVFINMDLESYMSYVNKARVYEYMENYKLIIDMNAYDRLDITKLNKVIKSIHDKNGKVCLDSYHPAKISLSDLKYIKCDYIKIDRELIKNVSVNDEKKKIISDIVTLGISSNIKIIAVGVETQEEYNALKSLDIKYIQGYYLAKPNKQIEELSKEVVEKLKDTSNDSIV